MKTRLWKVLYAAECGLLLWVWWHADVWTALVTTGYGILSGARYSLKSETKDEPPPPAPPAPIVVAHQYRSRTPRGGARY